MNHIKKLKEQNEYLKNSIEEIIEEIIFYQSYYSSDKFSGIDNDFAHVKTDIYPKLQELKTMIQNKLNNL